MPIILAIEPDRRQRTALGAVVRQRVGAELILADTTERALEAIGNRVPDLVLVPALLSPQDDAALAAALRVIAAAAHVRTLTIPVLANESKSQSSSGSGLLSRWRRGRDASPTPDGCDPAVFADQVAAYLAEAAAARAQLQLDDEAIADDPSFAGPMPVQPIAAPPIVMPSLTPPPIAAQPVVPPVVQPIAAHSFLAPPIVEPPVTTHTVATTPVFAEPFAYAPTVYEPAMNQPIVYEPVVEEPVVHQPVADEPLAAPVTMRYGSVFGLSETTDVPALDVATANAEEEEDIDLSSELAELSDDESEDGATRDDDTELFDGEPVGVYTMPMLTDEVEPLVLDEPAIAKPVAATPFVARPFVPKHVPSGRIEDDVFAHALEEIAVEARAVQERVSNKRVSDQRVIDQRVHRPAAEFSIERIVVDDFDVDDFEEFAVAEFGGQTGVVDVPAAASEIRAESGDPAFADHNDAEAWASASLARPHLWPTLEGVPAEIVVDTPRPVAPPARERNEWTELIASLRQDIERRRSEPAAAAAAVATADAATPKPRRQVVKTKPVQDEWGFFDPEQCGFAALLAKLDEITDGPEERDLPRH
jgi:hypothetical protein